MTSKIKLRSTALVLNNNDVKEMLKKNNFYCKSYPWNTEYANDDGAFQNNFFDNFDGTVTDNVTGLMWQKGSSPDYARWKDAQPYIDCLNKEHYAGYTDWRLPTIEELSTLMSREKLNNDLYVSKMFSDRMWFWSCDQGGGGTGRNWTDSSFAWAINFDYGSLFCLEISNAQDIRAVRTDVISPGRKFLREYLNSIKNMDIDGLLSKNYHKDAEVLSIDKVLKEPRLIKENISSMFDKCGRILSLSINEFSDSKDIVQFTAEIQTEKQGVLIEKCAMHLKDEKIWRQVFSIVPAKMQV